VALRFPPLSSATEQAAVEGVALAILAYAAVQEKQASFHCAYSLTSAPGSALGSLPCLIRDRRCLVQNAVHLHTRLVPYRSLPVMLRLGFA